jgi:hypothetical protein
MIPDYSDILTHLYPGCEWSLNDNDPHQLWWSPDNAEPAPDAETLDAAWPVVRDARAWAEVREERDRLLAASDWTQVGDAPLTDVELNAWQDYRQTLRDIPQDFPTPDDVVWPEQP